MKVLLALLLFPGSVFAASVPLYSVRIGLEPASKIPRWLVELAPPAGHHFNLSAPMRVESKSVLFQSIVKTDRRLGFAASSVDLTEKDILSTSAFLCDDAKTYCVKKSLELPLKADPDFQAFEKGTSEKPKGNKQKKDRFGFWVQDPESAIRESLQTGKPLLIDFYGVWCPPCNLYEELVFSKPSFQKRVGKFVLLRMDADLETSYGLKSKLRVGGYPTLVLAKIDSKDGSGSSITELGRVVGFMPEADLLARLEDFFKFRSESLDERILRQKQELLASLRVRMDRELEARNGVDALALIDQAKNLLPDYPELELLKIQARSMDAGSFQWTEDESKTLLGILSEPRKQESRLILLALGFMPEFGSKLPKEKHGFIYGAISELRIRVDSKHLFIPGLECSIADLDVLEMDIASSFSDQTRSMQAKKNAIASFEKLMVAQKNPDSRGLNLELASLLISDGQFERAISIYEKFILKFPKEFTFHLGAAKAYFEMNDLKNARLRAEEAVRYAYGDNLIRSMDRLLRIMHKQGETGFALKRGEEFLQGIHLDPSLHVRTGRYVSALSATLNEIRKEKPKP